MRLKFLHLAASTALFLITPAFGVGQSTDQSFPTNMTTNEVTGTMRARDIGDPRLTTYYFALGGGQGDLFINAATKNFSGDIDIFAAEGLRPLAKMVVYADGNDNETGRLVYLRKEERLILRIQGRTPNDDPATFRIKFGGSFIALGPNNDGESPTVAGNIVDKDSGVRVNSVGTIVEVIPKPTPVRKPVETVGEVRPAGKAKETHPPEPPSVRVAENIPARPVKTEPIKVKPARPAPPRGGSAGPATVFGSRKGKTPARPTGQPAKKAEAAKPAVKRTQPSLPTPEPEKKPDPLASIRLVVLLKNGDAIERPMSEVQKFSVDKGILTVIAKDGTIARYSILDVAKVTIQ